MSNGLSPLQPGDVPSLRRLAATWQRRNHFWFGVMASAVRRIADQLEADGGDRVIPIPGGELRVSPVLSADKVADLREAFIRAMQEIRAQKTKVNQEDEPT